MTRPVGEKQANAFGLHDMYGNVWEWCWDWLGNYPSSLSVDPKGPETGAKRVLRGQGWSNGELGDCRPSYRFALPPELIFANHDFGFRVARNSSHEIE
jgi:formylglycine-generating enzyme required for sulfatase activity